MKPSASKMVTEIGESITILQSPLTAILADGTVCGKISLIFNYRLRHCDQVFTEAPKKIVNCYSCLVGCCGFNDPLGQYFSLYRAVSQREGERKKK